MPISNIFGHSREFSQGLGGERIGADTFVISKDGSGDFDSIQEGINALSGLGGVIYIKEGVYTITSKIEVNKSNVALIGAGKASQITTSENIRMIEIDTQNNCVINNLRFTGAGGANTLNEGIVLATTNKIIIRDCLFEDCGGSGILTGGSDNNAYIVGNLIDGCGERGIHIAGDNNIISNNRITGCTEEGILLANGDDNIVIGNVISSNRRDGIWLTGGDDNVISSNWIKDNDFLNTTNHDGISLTNSDNNTITGNRIWENDRYEINVSDVNCSNNLIVGNNCLGTDHVGAINDVGTNSLIQGNMVA